MNDMTDLYDDSRICMRVHDLYECSFYGGRVLLMVQPCNLGRISEQIRHSFLIRLWKIAMENVKGLLSFGEPNSGTRDRWEKSKQ